MDKSAADELVNYKTRPLTYAKTITSTIYTHKEWTQLHPVVIILTHKIQTSFITVLYGHRYSMQHSTWMKQHSLSQDSTHQGYILGRNMTKGEKKSIVIHLQLILDVISSF